MDLNRLPPRVRSVAVRFPEDVDLLSNLIARDEEFGALCDDFTLATDVLRQLEESGGAENAGRRTEYRTLLRELERDIGNILAMHR
jgi:hypothetical protein